MKRLLMDLRYVFVCWFGAGCRRNFDPLAPCRNCGRALAETWERNR